jgi:hypothetical protein
MSASFWPFLLGNPLILLVREAAPHGKNRRARWGRRKAADMSLK